MAARTPPLATILARLQDVRGPDAQGWHTTRCIFHADGGHPNLRVNETGFRCMRCGESGPLGLLAERLGLAGGDDFEARIDAIYDYRDEHGALLYQCVRLRSPKDFRQRQPDGPGRWTWNLKGVRRVLYRLPELLASDRAEIVFVPEGEKDVDRLRSIGLVATCNPMGAGKWHQDFNQYLRGRRVVAIEDNDEEGRKHAAAVSRSLSAVSALVGVLRLPGLPAKGDVSDWLDAGGTSEQLLALAASALPAPDAPFEGLISARDLMAMDIPEPRWAIPGVLPEGLSILGGKPKTGKSWLALEWALAVAFGGAASGLIEVEQGQVLYLALEDTDRRLQDRLRQLLGGQPAPPTLTLGTKWERLDQGGLDRLELWLSLNKGARLVVIDTLAKVRTPRGKNDVQYDSDYQVVEGLKRLAEAHNIAILVVHHLRKQETVDPVDALSGTLGLSGAADGILVLKKERRTSEATLFITGRDVDEQELALAWDETLGSWRLAADAEQARLSKERQEMVELFKREQNRRMGPTLVARLLGRRLSGTKKLLWLMAKDGQLDCNDGRYSLPLLSNQGNKGNIGNQGNRSNQQSEDAGGVTSVTPREDSKVTANAPDSNLQGSDGYPVTGVTDVGRRPVTLRRRCASCRREISMLTAEDLCGRCSQAPGIREGAANA
jgi:hypothetical protein